MGWVLYKSNHILKWQSIIKSQYENLVTFILKSCPITYCQFFFNCTVYSNSTANLQYDLLKNIAKVAHLLITFIIRVKSFVDFCY